MTFQKSHVTKSNRFRLLFSANDLQKKILGILSGKIYPALTEKKIQYSSNDKKNNPL